jgi:uncharacterized membrane protein
MPRSHPKLVKCQVTGEELPRDQVVRAALVRPALIPLLRPSPATWDPQGYVSIEALNRARLEHVRTLMEGDAEDVRRLREEVARSLEREDTLSRPVDVDFDERLTLGQRVADRIASFGGSWTFILSFLAILVAWIAMNALLLRSRAFDPFPFILLNLVLSCLAALQAPVIMMSQNRQEQKDRLRGENDYRVNLKAELEIRHLHEKLDRLATDQWRHLMEVQQIQIDMIEELSNLRKG